MQNEMNVGKRVAPVQLPRSTRNELSRSISSLLYKATSRWRVNAASDNRVIRLPRKIIPVEKMS